MDQDMDTYDMPVVDGTPSDQPLTTADILPAAVPITLAVEGRGEYLCVGWDDCGCPVVLDGDGKLRRLAPEERVLDVGW